MSEELEKQDIHGSDWDYLIVLDACRYDIFEQNYSDFLEGELRKVESRGSATPEWLWETFTSRYNYTYISANPYINSAGGDLKEFVGECTTHWKATKTFSRIIDVWDEDWNQELGTVHPEDLTDTALETETDRKTVIHYIQPHRPYISSNINMHTWWAKEEIEESEKGPKRKMLEKTEVLWSPVFSRMPSKFQKKIKDLFNIGNSFEKLVNEVGEEKVKEYYRKDLRTALEQIERFVSETDGKVIVTADHGELLGENGEWGHPIGSRKPDLTHVPWLEVKNQ